MPRDSQPLALALSQMTSYEYNMLKLLLATSGTLFIILLCAWQIEENADHSWILSKTTFRQSAMLLMQPYRQQLVTRSIAFFSRESTCKGMRRYCFSHSMVNGELLSIAVLRNIDKWPVVSQAQSNMKHSFVYMETMHEGHHA